ncbi:MAG: chloride channel protein, partial [Bdellovibrionales bacterium]|nr:chloride channel protein [Bdellovibrionales bacterium]
MFLNSMKPSDLIDIPKITRSAIREIPKTWQSLNQTYLRPVTKKEVFRLNSMAILVGILAGYAAIGFRYLIGFFQNTILHHQLDWHLISPLDHVRGYWIFVILPMGLLISTLITYFFAREAKGHGVPEVIEAVMTRSGRIRKRVVALKALASSITIACGGSVGREGPIVQIGSAGGSAIGQLLNLEPKLLKTLVGCGAAGAIAATFNTPIAGVIFAIEIIVLELKTKSFVPLVISSVFATVVSRLYLGNEPAFYVPEYRLSGPNELIFYLALGILSGILGVIVIKSVYGFEDFFDNLKVPFWTKPLIGGLILAALATIFPQTMGVGYDTVTEVLQQKSSLTIMASLVFLKIFATSLTLASGGSGGVFAPSLFIGAMLGGTYGYLVNLYFPDVTAGYGAYALVGMAALFSATGRATFTAIVIL